MSEKVQELPRENFAVRQHLKYVDLYSNRTNYQTLTYEDTLVVREELAPLILPNDDREIVGLDMNVAKAAFSEYLESNNLDSRQIYFVNQIVEYIVHNDIMKDLSVLQESPFTD